MRAGPCRVRLGIDIKVQLIARFAIGAAGDEFRAVSHDDGDIVVIGMSFGFMLNSFKMNGFCREADVRMQVYLTFPA